MGMCEISISDRGRASLGRVLCLLNLLTVVLAEAVLVLLLTAAPRWRRDQTLYGARQVTCWHRLLLVAALTAGALHLLGAKLCPDCGYWWSRHRFQAVLLRWTLAVLVSAGVTFAAAVVTLSAPARVASGLQARLAAAMAGYRDDPRQKAFFDRLQQRGRCCGVRDYRDWLNTSWLRREDVPGRGLSIDLNAAYDNLLREDGSLVVRWAPWSCCDPEYGDICNSVYDLLPHPASYCDGLRRRNSVLQAGLPSDAELEAIRPHSGPYPSLAIAESTTETSASAGAAIPGPVAQDKSDHKVNNPPVKSKNPAVKPSQAKPASKPPKKEPVSKPRKNPKPKQEKKPQPKRRKRPQQPTTQRSGLKPPPVNQRPTFAPPLFGFGPPPTMRRFRSTTASRGPPPTFAPPLFNFGPPPFRKGKKRRKSGLLRTDEDIGLIPRNSPKQTGDVQSVTESTREIVSTSPMTDFDIQMHVRNNHPSMETKEIVDATNTERGGLNLVELSKLNKDESFRPGDSSSVTNYANSLEAALTSNTETSAQFSSNSFIVDVATRPYPKQPASKANILTIGDDANTGDVIIPGDATSIPGDARQAMRQRRSAYWIVDRKPDPNAPFPPDPRYEMPDGPKKDFLFTAPNDFMAEYRNPLHDCNALLESGRKILTRIQAVPGLPEAMQARFRDSSIYWTLYYVVNGITTTPDPRPYSKNIMQLIDRWRSQDFEHLSPGEVARRVIRYFKPCVETIRPPQRPSRDCPPPWKHEPGWYLINYDDDQYTTEILRPAYNEMEVFLHMERTGTRDVVFTDFRNQRLKKEIDGIDAQLKLMPEYGLENPLAMRYDLLFCRLKQEPADAFFEAGCLSAAEAQTAGLFGPLPYLLMATAALQLLVAVLARYLQSSNASAARHGDLRLTAYGCLVGRATVLPPGATDADSAAAAVYTEEDELAEGGIRLARPQERGRRPPRQTPRREKRGQKKQKKGKKNKRRRKKKKRGRRGKRKRRRRKRQ